MELTMQPQSYPAIEALLAELDSLGIRINYLSNRPLEDLSGGATQTERWICSVSNERGSGWARGATCAAAIAGALASYTIYPRPENLDIVRRAVAAEPRIARRATAEDLDLL